MKCRAHSAQNTVNRLNSRRSCTFNMPLAFHTKTTMWLHHFISSRYREGRRWIFCAGLELVRCIHMRSIIINTMCAFLGNVRPERLIEWASATADSKCKRKASSTIMRWGYVHSIMEYYLWASMCLCECDTYRCNSNRWIISHIPDVSFNKWIGRIGNASNKPTTKEMYGKW